MKQTHQQKKKKKKRSRATNPSPNNAATPDNKEDGKKPADFNNHAVAINSLMEVFDCVSLEEATAAYNEAEGDPNEAAAILSNLLDNCEDPSSSSVWSGSSGLDSGSSSGYGPGSTSSEGLMEVQNIMNGKGFRGSKQKRVVAATGTVSTMLGKDYVRSSPRKESTAKLKGSDNNSFTTLKDEDAEQFLYSMLGDDCELSIAVVRDVLCQCGYNIDKALDVLIDMASSSFKHSMDNRCFNTERSDTLAGRASDCMSHMSESEVKDNFWSMNFGYRNYSEVLTSSEAPSQTSQRSCQSDVPQQVLESLFNISHNPEHEPNKMNWRSVVNKMKSLGPGFDVCSSSFANSQKDAYVKGNEYNTFRKPADQHWSSMRSYYQKATAAYSKGERGYAAYLSDQGKVKSKLAREADERASKDIFLARNQGIENVITIDLHGQHVQQAIRLLKLHLLFGSYVPSVQILRVITGSGIHGAGKSQLKQSVTKLLVKEGLQWKEENQGTVLIKLDGEREFSFLDSDSDTS